MKLTLFNNCRGVAIALLLAGLQSTVVFAGSQVEAKIHENHPLSAQGKVVLDNVNGKIHITAWDKDEVQVDAVKRAEKQEHLDAVKIEISATPDAITIHTKYPRQTSGFFGKSNNNTTKVDYEIKVPAKALLERVENVNGSVEIEGVRGKVHATTVNGRLSVKGIASDAELESVNGAVEATFEEVKDIKSASLKTVNGKAEIALPAGADASLSGKTVNGSIHADGLSVKKKLVGSELTGTLGKGGAQISAETVNGSIRISQLSSR